MVSNVEPENGTRSRVSDSLHCAHSYEHWYYEGKRSGTVPASNFDFGNELVPEWNDFISSLTVKAGCRIKFYEHPCRTGNSVTYTRDTPWVGHYWNDKFSSVICLCDL
jgi:hypothetical protein